MTRRRAKVDGVELANLPPAAPPNGGAPLVAVAAAPPPPTPAEERREQDLDDVLQEIGNESRIRVWHVIEGKAAYAGELNGDGFSLETLLDVFGGGDKTLKVYQGNTCRYTVRVSLDPSVPVKSPRTGNKAAIAVAPQSTGDQMMSVMGTMMAQQANAMTAIMSGVAAMMANNKPQADPVLTELIKAMGAKHDVDPMALVTKVLEMTKRETTQQSSAAELFNIFEKGMKLGQGVAGGGENGGIDAMMTEGIKALGNLIDGIVTKQKADAARITAGLPPAPPAVSTTETHPATKLPLVQTGTPPGEDLTPRPGEPLWVAAARPHIGMMVTAARWLSPEAAADSIDRNLTDEQFESLVQDIENQEGGGFGARLIEYFPAVAEVDPNWIGALVTALIQTDEDDPAIAGSEP